jgi:hypothetical protein
MYTMINGGGHFRNGLGPEQETQGKGFDIDMEPLFPHVYHQMEELMAMYDEAEDE